MHGIECVAAADLFDVRHKFGQGDLEEEFVTPRAITVAFSNRKRILDALIAGHARPLAWALLVIEAAQAGKDVLREAYVPHTRGRLCDGGCGTEE